MKESIARIINLYNNKSFDVALSKIDLLLQDKNFSSKNLDSLPGLYNLKGLIYLSLGLLNESKDNLILSIKLSPRFFPAYHNLGIIYFRLGQYESSMENYNKAVEINPNLPEVYNDMGALLMHQQKFEDAAKKFTEALKYNPNLKNAYTNLIKTLSKINKNDDEKNEFFQVKKNLRKINCKFSSDYKIKDEDVKNFIDKSFQIMPKNIINLEFDDEQVFRETNEDLNCKRHFNIFNKHKIIPNNCFGCYKILIEPKNVLELIKLYLVFDNLKLDHNFVRKCMIETRPNVKGSYKGYIFLSSKEEAETFISKINDILKKTINENISTSIKRGCSEFAEIYPTYAEINDKEKTLKYNPKWKDKENQIDKNYPYLKKIINFRETVKGTSIHDILTIKNWLIYSKLIEDNSYKKITNDDFYSTSMEKKLTKQIQFRKEQHLNE